jgi:hypothetical protein
MYFIIDSENKTHYYDDGSFTINYKDEAISFAKKLHMKTVLTYQVLSYLDNVVIFDTKKIPKLRLVG